MIGTKKADEIIARQQTIIDNQAALLDQTARQHAHEQYMQDHFSVDWPQRLEDMVSAMMIALKKSDVFDDSLDPLAVAREAREDFVRRAAPNGRFNIENYMDMSLAQEGWQAYRDRKTTAGNARASGPAHEDPLAGSLSLADCPAGYEPVYDFSTGSKRIVDFKAKPGMLDRSVAGLAAGSMAIAAGTGAVVGAANNVGMARQNINQAGGAMNDAYYNPQQMASPYQQPAQPAYQQSPYQNPNAASNCSSCSTPLNGAKFCPNCGTKSGV